MPDSIFANQAAASNVERKDENCIKRLLIASDKSSERMDSVCKQSIRGRESCRVT
jgi:hypothetical protein